MLTLCVSIGWRHWKWFLVTTRQLAWSQSQWSLFQGRSRCLWLCCLSGRQRLPGSARKWIPSSNWDVPDVSKGLVLRNGRTRTNKDVYTTHFKSISLHRFANIHHKNIMIWILFYHLEEDSKYFRNSISSSEKMREWLFTKYRILHRCLMPGVGRVHYTPVLLSFRSFDFVDGLNTRPKTFP